MHCLQNNVCIDYTDFKKKIAQITDDDFICVICLYNLRNHNII